jgi:hypothetical protein
VSTDICYGSKTVVSESIENFFKESVLKLLGADMLRHVIWWIVTNVSKKFLPPSSV